jgi:hypothetical protein
MIKKFGIIALLALIIIPAGVMAAGMKGSGAGGSQMASDNALQFQQGGESQAAQGPYVFSSQNGIAISDDKGNGDLLRIRTRDQLQTGDQLQNRTRSQLQTGGQVLMVTSTGDQLQAVTGSGDQLQTRDKLQTMTRLRSQLMDGSCGNCPKLTITP